MREVAPGIHVREGEDAEATASNAGGIANIGFIVGRDGVAVIDPGGSLEDGARLRSAIRRATALPIRYVVMTHVHPDHIFGAEAFVGDKPVFIGHAGLPAALAQRGEYYRKRLEAVLGAAKTGKVIVPTQLIAPMQSVVPTQLVAPTQSGAPPQVVAPTQWVDLGRRVLDLRAFGKAHTDCDLTVLDRQTQTLFASDLVFVRRVPSLDGSLTGWLKALTALKTIPAQRVVPGHGPASVNWPSATTDLERYLNTVLTETRDAIAKGLDLDAAVKSVGHSERGRWQLFEDYHERNVTQALKELEWAAPAVRAPAARHSSQLAKSTPAVRHSAPSARPSAQVP